jgi:hypothetical protein
MSKDTITFGESVVYDKGQRVDIISANSEWTLEAARRLYGQPELIGALKQAAHDFDVIADGGVPSSAGRGFARWARAAITKAEGGK